MKKNDVFTVTIEDMGEDGAGIGKTDGYTWFIKDALIGDVIQASVMKMKKNYGFARLVKILEPAPARVEPRCPVARACGGCQLQELDYREQLRFKERKVYNIETSHLNHQGPIEHGEEQHESCGCSHCGNATEAQVEVMLFASRTCPNCKRAAEHLDRCLS